MIVHKAHAFQHLKDRVEEENILVITANYKSDYGKESSKQSCLFIQEEKYYEGMAALIMIK